MEATIVCPKCNGAMTEGFGFDQSQGTVFVNTWVEGHPEKSLIRGTKIEGKQQFHIAAYRCQQCGYLESYAREEVN